MVCRKSWVLCFNINSLNIWGPTECQALAGNRQTGPYPGGIQGNKQQMFKCKEGSESGRGVVGDSG